MKNASRIASRRRLDLDVFRDAIDSALVLIDIGGDLAVRWWVTSRVFPIAGLLLDEVIEPASDLSRSLRRILRRHGPAAALSGLLRDHWTAATSAVARIPRSRRKEALRLVARALGADPETGQPVSGEGSFAWEELVERDPLGYCYIRGRSYPRYTGADGGPFVIRGGRLVSVKTLAYIPSHRGSEIRIAASLYNGRPRLDVRRWVPDREQPGIFKPTQQGFAIEASAIAAFLRKLSEIGPELDAAWQDLQRRDERHDDPRERRSASSTPGIA